MIDILLVDDHDLVRLGIKYLLTDKPEIQVVSEASSGEEAIRLYRELKPDVVLMDLKMPGIGGLETTRRLLRQDPNARIIILTSCDEEPFPYRMMRAGALGYITKTADIEELLNAINKVYLRQPYMTREIAQRLALRQMVETGKSPFSELSEREMQVMWMVTRGYNVQKIAEKLYLSPKTVNTYRYRIFEKLGVTNDVELTHLAFKHGILDQPLITGIGEAK